MKTLYLPPLALGLLLSLCMGSGTSALAAAHKVRVSNNVFTPSNLAIAQGDTVEFELAAGFHTVTGTGSDPFCGNSAISATSCKVTFNTPGVFPYRCIFHSTGGPTPAGMVGSVTVVSSTPVQLEGAATITGTYAAVGGATADAVARTFTVPLPAGAAFWRLRAATQLRITSVAVLNGKVVLKYE